MVCVNPIIAFYYTAASNGLSAPQLTALVIMIANRRDIREDSSFESKQHSGWMIVLMITLAGMALIINLVTGQ